LLRGQYGIGWQAPIRLGATALTLREDRGGLDDLIALPLAPSDREFVIRLLAA
jgi:hypothetical protein